MRAADSNDRLGFKLKKFKKAFKSKQKNSTPLIDGSSLKHSRQNSKLFKNNPLRSHSGNLSGLGKSSTGSKSNSRFHKAKKSSRFHQNSDPNVGGG